MTTSRIVVFRLSSFGDVVLATAALAPVKRKFPKSHVIFVTSKNFAPLVHGHPSVDEVIGFERSEGVKGWLRLLETLWASGVDHVFDLHNSTRTKIGRLYFAWKSIVSARKYSWVSVSKQRIRHFFYYIFKRILPQLLRPEPWSKRFVNCVDPSLDCADLDLSYLLVQSGISSHRTQENLKGISENYLCVMPSSRWTTKEWELEKWVQLLESLQGDVVVLGQGSDKTSQYLYQRLKDSFGSGRQVFFYPKGLDFSEWAKILKSSQMFLGVDTGFFHLAEGLGVKSLVVFGPTESGLGYGPRLPSTQVAERKLFCRPCSKTGQICFRFWEPRACLKQLEVEDVGKLLRHF
jgi:ADP-heptose:LPS heptosyltransferase